MFSKSFQNFLNHNYMMDFCWRPDDAILLIDASKAFDRVSHIKLFKTLQAHGVCPLIIRVLYNMYTNSDMQVRWKSELF